MTWFPLPRRPLDIVLFEPHGGWTSERVFEHLHDESAAEWRDRVGVVSPADGSAKPSTRLLLARDSVFKTRVDTVWPTLEQAWVQASRARGMGLVAGAWHPDKVWALMHVEAGWVPLTICPELVTLRRCSTFLERRRGWCKMLDLTFAVGRESGLGLDVNPANFGTAARGTAGGSTALYYLDEELYPSLRIENVASALASRLPEEHDAQPEDWRTWGEELALTVNPAPFTWSDVREAVNRYPLAGAFEPHRLALVQGLHTPRPRTSPPAPRLTCVLADVHSNLRALDAVLADARERGADSYLFLGDAVGYGPDPAACIARLAELPHATFVRGNHDHAIGSGPLNHGMNRLARACSGWTREQLNPSELAWLDSLPLDHLAGEWMAVHGAPRDPHRFLAYVYEMTYQDNLAYLRERRIALCFYGHTHVQLTQGATPGGYSRSAGPGTIHIERGRTYLVNPGSVGQPRDGDPRAGYALWDRKQNVIQALRVPYPVDETSAAVRRAGLPVELAERLRVGQ